MKNINHTMDEVAELSTRSAAKGTREEDKDSISIVERIVQKTGNRKLAAILALDLFLVGVDTVIRCYAFLVDDLTCIYFLLSCGCVCFYFVDIGGHRLHYLSIGQESRETTKALPGVGQHLSQCRGGDQQCQSPRADALSAGLR